MYSNEPIKYKPERRKKPDIICRFIDVAVIIVWLLIIAVLTLLHFAQPRQENFFDRLLGVEVRKTADLLLLDTAFYILVLLFVFSLVSLILNTRRLKRRSDYIRISFILSLIGSCAGIIIYTVYYAI